MRNGRLLAAAILSAAVLSGCNTTSEADYKLGQSVLASEPAIKKEIIRDCKRDAQNDPIGEKRTGAALMNVSVANYPDALCRRIVNAVASGRLSYDEVQSALRGGDASELIKVMQGR